MPSRVLTRRDPPNGKKEFSNHNGFTVIELMIVVGMLAIVTALALPSYRAIMEKRQVTSGAEQISAYLSSAQLEAVKRNREVGIRCSQLAGGCDTVQLAQTEDDADLVLRTLEFAGLKADIDAVTYGVADDTDVVFDPVRGLLVQEDMVERPIEIQLSSKSDMYSLNVRVTPTGGVLMCSDKARGDRCVPGVPSCSAEPELAC